MIINLEEEKTLKSLSSMCGGFANNDCKIKSISIDSREIGEATLFVALKGENNDGHKFIGKAIENGAKCIMCEKVPEDFSGDYILVENSVKALCDISKKILNEKKPFVVGVTGSVGKTTTKEFISYVLSRNAKTIKSGGNFNTIYGLCLTVCSMGDEKNAVFEMGMSARGEISEMTNVACPDLAVITNIGTSHLEALGSRENIAKAKLEICEGLKEDGFLICNGDEILLKEGTKDRQDVLYFGIDNECCHIIGKNIRVSESGTVFDIETELDTYTDVEIKAVGKHNVYNALCAFCVGLCAGMNEKDIRLGLLDYKTTGMRQNVYSKNGYTVIEDCYNASPESMKAALSVLADVGKSKRKIAVLGDMRELGKTSEEMHRNVGKLVFENKIDFLFTFGELAENIAKGAKDAGFCAENIICVKNSEEFDTLAEKIKNEIKPGDVLLFKASRAISLENVIKLI